MADIVSLEAARKHYQRGPEEVRAIDGVTLRIAEGDYIAVVGRSGSGKTTLLNLIGCVDRPTDGTVQVHGMETAELTDNQLATIRSTTVGFIFQQFFLIPTLTAKENVMLPGRFSARHDGDLSGRAESLLEMVGLSERVDHLPRELSGGEMQRVAIARALINEPAILLADEPTGNLDTASAAQIAGIIDGLNEGGLTVVVVTHSAELAGNATRVMRLQDGRILEEERLKPAPAPLAGRGPMAVPDYIPPPRRKMKAGLVAAALFMLASGAVMFSTAFMPFIGKFSGYRLMDPGLFTFVIHRESNLTRAFSEKPVVLLTGLWPLLLGIVLVVAAGLVLFGRRRSGGWLAVTAGALAAVVAMVDLVTISNRLGPGFAGGYGLWVLLGLGAGSLLVGLLLLLLGRGGRARRDGCEQEDGAG